MNATRRVIVPFDLSPAAPALGAVVHALQGETMGTSWCVKYSGARGADLLPLGDAIQSRLDTVVAQMSPWEEDSGISRFNRAPAQSWHALPDEFAQVIECALQLAEASGGAFDPTAGELVALWGFGPAGRVSTAPPPDALAAARTRAGWHRLIRRDGLLQQPGGSTLDLSAIAKGHGVDLVSRLLLERGVENHLVEVGGELRGCGVRPDGQPWWVDLQAPPAAAGLPGTRVALHGLSVATSGDYLRCFVDERGIRRSHTIDPRSGSPIEHALASVSVLHAECMHADALSTALGVLGREEGMAFARRFDVAALFVERRGTRFVETLSPALEAMAA